MTDAEAASLRTENKRLRWSLEKIRDFEATNWETVAMHARGTASAALRTTPGGPELDPGTVEACAKLVDRDADANRVWRKCYACGGTGRTSAPSGEGKR